MDDDEEGCGVSACHGGPTCPVPAGFAEGGVPTPDARRSLSECLHVVTLQHPPSPRPPDSQGASLSLKGPSAHPALALAVPARFLDNQ